MADTYMMTAEELRLHRRKRRRILLFVIALVLVGVGGFFGARPARDAIKGWQARRHADKAFAFIEQEKWTDARDEAVAAYQLRPNEPEALRAVARFLSRTRQQEALEFWKQLQDRQPLTREDRRDEVAIALAANDLPRAEHALNDLLTRKDSTPAAFDWILAAQVAQQKGDSDEAKKATQKVLDDAGADERSQFQAALLTIGMSLRENSDAAAMEPAWTRIRKLAEGKSKSALDALVVLAQQALSNQRTASGSDEPTARREVRGQRSDDRGPKTASGSDEPTARREDRGQRTEQISEAELARALESHPLAAAPHKLLALDLQMHADPSQRDALIDRAIADWKDADTIALAALATWLNGKGEYQRELDTIPLEKALQSRDLLLQHADALGALDRWDEIKRVLESERFPLDPVIQRMYLARCNAQLGEKTAGENNWQRALEAAGADAGKLLTLAEYAEKNGTTEIASTAYDRAVAATPKLRVAHQGRLRIAQTQRDTRKIHGLLAEMLRLWPNDAAIQNDEAYTKLLLGGRWEMEDGSLKSDLQNSSETPSSNSQLQSSAELKAIVDLAENLVKRNPRSLPHRTLLALAYLRQNRPAEALAVYENIQVAPAALTPSALAVHAAVLAANGRNDDAKTEVKDVKRGQLLPEERALLEAATSGE